MTSRLFCPVFVAALSVLPLESAAQTTVSMDAVGPWVPVHDARATNDGDSLVIHSGMLRTTRLYSDFIFHVEFRLNADRSEGNVYVRTRLDYGGRGSKRGYRIALGNTTEGKDAMGRVTGHEQRMTENAFAKAPLGATGEWQTCDVRAERDRMSVRINGSVVSSIEGLDEFTGYIVLEARNGGITFRNAQAARLPFAEEPFGRDARPVAEFGRQVLRPLEQPKPFYPQEAFNDRIQGAVLVEAVVDKSGAVGDVRIVRSLHPDLDEVALATARKWRFTPPMLSGESVKVIVTIELSFAIAR